MADYNLEGPKWASGVVTYSFATSNRSGQPAAFSTFLQPGAYEQEIVAALGVWSAVTNIQFVQVADSINADIRFGYGVFDGPYGTIGQAYYSYDANGHFLPDIMIRFDEAETYSPSSQGLVLPTGVRFEAVALHEIGHALGLDHYNTAPAIMNSTASANVTTLTQSDLDGIHALYGVPVSVAQLTPAHSWTVNFDGNAADILWNNADGRSAIWEISSAGIVGSTYLPTVPSKFSIASVFDSNGDGHSDILWRGDDGTVAIWDMNGTSIVASAYLPSVPSSFAVVGTGDFNFDGKDDIIWRSSDGTNAIWEMNGSNIIGSAYLPSVPTSFSVTAMGDFNGDHKSDVLWHSSDGTTAMWLMDGMNVASGQYLPSMPSAYDAVVGDFSGDGKDDIFWVSAAGSTTEWLMNGSQITSSSSSSVASGSKIAGMGDFNGDGKQDLLWEAANDTYFIWQMNGTQATSTPLASSVNGLDVQSVGDYNNDGKDDILFRDHNGTAEIAHMNGGTVLDIQPLPLVPTDWHIV